MDRLRCPSRCPRTRRNPNRWSSCRSRCARPRCCCSDPRGGGADGDGGANPSDPGPPNWRRPTGRLDLRFRRTTPRNCRALHLPAKKIHFELLCYCNKKVGNGRRTVLIVMVATSGDAHIVPPLSGGVSFDGSMASVVVERQVVVAFLLVFVEIADRLRSRSPGGVSFSLRTGSPASGFRRGRDDIFGQFSFDSSRIPDFGSSREETSAGDDGRNFSR